MKNNEERKKKNNLNRLNLQITIKIKKIKKLIILNYPYLNDIRYLKDTNYLNDIRYLKDTNYLNDTRYLKDTRDIISVG